MTTDVRSAHDREGEIGLDPTRTDAAEALFAYRRRMNDFRLRPATSALILVDLQYGSAADGYGFANVFRAIGYADLVDAYNERIERVVVPSVQRLQGTFRDVGAPVIFLTVGSVVGDLSDMPPRFRRAADHWTERGLNPPYAVLGSREMQVLESIAPLPGEPVLAKTGASGFTASPLERLLWNLGSRELVFCGVATNYCVESTLRDAADRGFDCVLVEDGCADVTPEIHDVGIKSSSPFCRVSTADEVISEIRQSP